MKLTCKTCGATDIAPFTHDQWLDYQRDKNWARIPVIQDHLPGITGQHQTLLRSNLCMDCYNATLPEEAL